MFIKGGVNLPKQRKKFKTFLNDGLLSEKDYLMTISTGVFFIFVSIGLIMILLQKTFDPMYLSLLNMVSEVVMTIVISVFGVDGIGKVTSYLEKKEENRDSTMIKTTVETVENSESGYNSSYVEDDTRKEDDII